MTGNRICLFKGEFLWHPAPLELSGDSCSNNCCYCFANIRNAHLQIDQKGVFNFFSTISTGNTLEKILVRAGFPICVSNRTDPLSDSNWGDFRHLAEIFNSIENGIYWQTKGGREEYNAEFLDIISKKKKQVVYITITTLNDDISRHIEPRAAVASERLNFAKELRKRGIDVIVAVNPMVRAWMSDEDFERLCIFCRDNGINKMMAQSLHLSKAEIATFSEARKRSFYGLDYEKEVSEQTEGLISLCDIRALKAREYGIKYNYPDNKLHSGYEESVRESLGKCFPTIGSFIDWCYENKQDGDEITFEDFYNALTCHSGLKEFFEESLPHIDGYLFKNARQVWRGSYLAQSIKNYKELLRYYYGCRELGLCILNNATFEEERGHIYFWPKDINLLAEMERRWKDEA